MKRTASDVSTSSWCHEIFCKWLQLIQRISTRSVTAMKWWWWHRVRMITTWENPTRKSLFTVSTPFLTTSQYTLIHNSIHRNSQSRWWPRRNRALSLQRPLPSRVPLRRRLRERGMCVTNWQHNRSLWAWQLSKRGATEFEIQRLLVWGSRHQLWLLGAMDRSWWTELCRVAECTWQRQTRASVPMRSVLWEWFQWWSEIDLQQRLDVFIDFKTAVGCEKCEATWRNFDSPPGAAETLAWY